LEAKQQLDKLLRIQDLVLETRAAVEVLERAPIRLDEIESSFRDRNTEYVAVQDRYDALEEDRNHRTTELATLEAQRDKYMADLMEVKNQREYAAMLKEIDQVKAVIAEHEEAIITDMEEIEKVTVELKAHEEHIKAERIVVEKQRADVDAEAEAARTTVHELGAERQELESDLPKSMLATMHQLETTRQGIFLSKAENGTCLACFVRVRPQMFQEIKLATKIHSCGSCRRFLYYEPVLRPASEGGTQDASSVEAVNGGAV
jgi:predicted  nucleic acid-binding Zn-ribbon protein